jgi:hypothetical protein
MPALLLEGQAHPGAAPLGQSPAAPAGGWGAGAACCCANGLSMATIGTPCTRCSGVLRAQGGFCSRQGGGGVHLQGKCGPGSSPSPARLTSLTCASSRTANAFVSIDPAMLQRGLQLQARELRRVRPMQEMWVRAVSLPAGRCARVATTQGYRNNAPACWCSSCRAPLHSSVPIKFRVQDERALGCVAAARA